MDHIETKILNSYTIQEAAQNMVFAARLLINFETTYRKFIFFQCNIYTDPKFSSCFYDFIIKI